MSNIGIFLFIKDVRWSKKTKKFIKGIDNRTFVRYDIYQLAGKYYNWANKFRMYPNLYME